MDYLCDTNIFLRLVVKSDPARGIVFEALRKLRSRGDRLFYTSQILAEFWNVCTRPVSARGGLGLSVRHTERKTQLIERRFSLLSDSLATHREWRRLIVTHAVSGVQVHDARIVAVMNIYYVPNLLTLNGSDFIRYPAINAIDPKDVK